MHKRYSDPVSYLLLPSDFPIEELPPQLALELVKPRRSYRESEDSEGEGR